MLPRPAALLTLALLGGWGLPAGAQQPLPPAAGETVPFPYAAPPQLLPATPVFTAAQEAEPAVDASPFRPPSGWFASLEVFAAWPHVSNIDSSSDGYEPIPYLDLTVAPRVILGYRLEGGNALLVSYRYLGSSGSASDYWGNWHDRLETHWLDFDYRGCLHGPWHGFTFQWQAGTRVASVEDNLRDSFPGFWAADRLQFRGGGAHVGFDLNWYIPETRLGLFARGDGGALLGSSRERVNFQFQDGTGPFPTQLTSHHTLGMLNGQAEVGVSWTPATQRWLRLETGFQLFDFAWDGENFANFGPFVRFEIGF
jgi:hypothetical protein